MAACVGILATLLLASSARAQDGASAVMPRRLTNQDVISMVKLGLSEDVIITKIRTASGNGADSVSFDTGVEGLKALKAANVPDSVIKVMINPAPPPPTIITASTPMTIDPNLPPPEVGVYPSTRYSSNCPSIQSYAAFSLTTGQNRTSFISSLG